MIVLDTNVISEEMKTEPDPRVHAWFLMQPVASLFTTAVCEAEILWGIHQLPQGKKRAALAAAAQNVLGLFAGRILPFDSSAAPHFADIMEMRRRAGRRVGEMDPMIAAVTRSRGFALATRNTVDFDDNWIKLINPWHA
jgi:toxin FitB